MTILLSIAGTFFKVGFALGKRPRQNIPIASIRQELQETKVQVQKDRVQLKLYIQRAEELENVISGAADIWFRCFRIGVCLLRKFVARGSRCKDARRARDVWNLRRVAESYLRFLEFLVYWGLSDKRNADIHDLRLAGSGSFALSDTSGREVLGRTLRPRIRGLSVNNRTVFHVMRSKSGEPDSSSLPHFRESEARRADLNPTGE